MTVASPCVGYCKLDPVTGFCLGCARTGEELMGWGSKPDAQRDAVWAALPARFDQLGVTSRRLPWDTDRIRAFVVESLRDGRGTWVAGVVGAIAEFATAEDTSVTVHQHDAEIRAETQGGALRFVIDDNVQALSVDPSGTPEAERRIVLAVKRDRGRLPRTEQVAPLGPDDGAVHPANRTNPLFDMGLGRKAARFLVRCPGGMDIGARSGATPPMDPSLIPDQSVRIVETLLGRIEVSAPPPAAGQMPAPGPQAYLSPESLARGQDMPDGITLPRAYMPGAIFYPPLTFQT